MQTVPVPTFGKGKDYSRVEPVHTVVSLHIFRRQLGPLLEEYTHHTILAWYLANSKIEIMRPLTRRARVLVVITDFAENVKVIRKHELSDQYFHRPEILLFGAVASVCLPEGGDQEIQLLNSSYMVCSDYRLVCSALAVNILLTE